MYASCASRSSRSAALSQAVNPASASRAATRNSRVFSGWTMRPSLAPDVVSHCNGAALPGHYGARQGAAQAANGILGPGDLAWNFAATEGVSLTPRESDTRGRRE